MGRKTKPAENNESGDIFLIEKILDKKIVNGCPYYKVKWLNYAMKDCTWEPKENFSCCLDTIEEFEEKLKKQSDTKQKRRLERLYHKECSSSSDPNDSSTSATPKATPLKRICNNTRYVDKILGATDEESKSNKDGLWMFLVKYSDGSHELMERKIANVKCPQVVINYYQANLVWKQKTNTDKNTELPKESNSEERAEQGKSDNEKHLEDERKTM